MTSYPLTLTVEYEDNSSGRSYPYGYAVVRLGETVVHREPVNVEIPAGQEKDWLESAAAQWLARITGEAAAR